MASARVGALTTYPCEGRPVLTSVNVHKDAGRPGGAVWLSLPAGGEAARSLAVRPLDTVAASRRPGAN